MENTRKKKNTTPKQVEEQAAKTSGQENTKLMTSDNNDTNGDRSVPECTDTAELKESKKDKPIETQKPEKPLNTFAPTLANGVMTRIYELYGYSIKGNACKTIISQAQQYAKERNITINTDIETINTHELYDHIVNLISNGYSLSPLDTTYNDIFLRAVIERYKT